MKILKRTTVLLSMSAVGALVVLLAVMADSAMRTIRNMKYESSVRRYE